jgi:hypothetical protein
LEYTLSAGTRCSSFAITGPAGQDGQRKTRVGERIQGAAHKPATHHLTVLKSGNSDREHRLGAIHMFLGNGGERTLVLLFRLECSLDADQAARTKPPT